MCGIVGIVSTTKTAHIEAANQQIEHRGPDSGGVYRSGSLALGHRRLSILDLSKRGHQPMHSGNGRYVIVFNGEIYNHLELRKKLRNKSAYKSNSDTETILRGFEEFGTNLFGMLNGIFALAIHDTLENKIILARDHYGVKPLYYYHKDHELIFGSEMKSFLPIKGWDRAIDHRSLVNYLHYQYSPGKQTPFLHVRKFPPGHFAELELDGGSKLSLTRFYQIPFTGEVEEAPLQDWTKRVDDSFSSAVERQLLSDVPVGFFLSGGLDSSLIVAKAREILGQKLDCFTIDTGFEKNNKEGFVNDLYYAKKVAKQLDVRLEVVPGRIDILEDFDKMIWHLDEPQSDPAPLNVLNISREARKQGIKVLLGGTGGDDVFSGYRRHQALAAEPFFDLIPNKAGKAIDALIKRLPGQHPIGRRVKKLSNGLAHSKLDRMSSYFRWMDLNENHALFDPQVRAGLENYDPSTILIDSLSDISDEKSILNKMLYWELTYFLTDHNLNYTDKMSMAVGLEARVPYLDPELVNLSTRIPTRYKLKGREPKFILKKVAEKYLSKEIIYRPKTGFGAPVREWITGDMEAMIHDYLDPQKIRTRGIFDPKAVWSLIDANKKGEIDASYNIWTLLSIESWMRQFVDSENH